MVTNNLETICSSNTDNFTISKRASFNHLKKKHQSLIIKTADKNLGIVLMDTDEYIHECINHLSDKTTYSLVADYPASEIHNKLTSVLVFFKRTLENFHKRLYRFLTENSK